MKKAMLCLALALLLLCLPAAAAEGAADPVYLNTSPLVIIGALAAITLLRKGRRRR